jgi:hypothetical protein
MIYCCRLRCDSVPVFFLGDCFLINLGREKTNIRLGRTSCTGVSLPSTDSLFFASFETPVLCSVAKGKKEISSRSIGVSHGSSNGVFPFPTILLRHSRRYLYTQYLFARSDKKYKIKRYGQVLCTAAGYGRHGANFPITKTWRIR